MAAKNGHTPLHIAAKKNQVNILLLQYTVFFCIVEWNVHLYNTLVLQLDVASTLLMNQSDVNAESKAGFSPLHLSAQEGHVEMSKLLLELKSDVNLQSKVSYDR